MSVLAASSLDVGVAVGVVLCVVAGTAELCFIVIVADLMPLERQQSLHKLRLEAVGRQAHSKQLRAQLRDLQPAYSSLAWPLLLGCGLQPRRSDNERSKRHGTCMCRNMSKGGASQPKNATHLDMAPDTPSTLLTPSGSVQAL